MSVDLKEINYEERYGSQKRFLSPDDLEEEFGFPKAWQAKARTRRQGPKLPHIKIGRWIKYDRIEILSFLKEHTVVGA